MYVVSSPFNLKASAGPAVAETSRLATEVAPGGKPGELLFKVSNPLPIPH